MSQAVELPDKALDIELPDKVIDILSGEYTHIELAAGDTRTCPVIIS